MQLYLLDTNVWIQVLKGQNSALSARVRMADPASIRLCSVVKAELFHGAHRYELRERRLAVLESLFAAHPSLPFDDRAAATYGVLRHDLERAGLTIGPLDLQIAAIAVTHGLVLVSANLREFERVPTLRVEDWGRPPS